MEEKFEGDLMWGAVVLQVVVSDFMQNSLVFGKHLSSIFTVRFVAAIHLSSACAALYVACGLWQLALWKSLLCLAAV